MTFRNLSRRTLMTGAAVLAVTLGTAPVAFAQDASSQGADAAQPQLVDGKLPALEDGFPNREIVLLVVDEPGSIDSVMASQLAEAASKISPQPVVVEHRVDFTNFGTWEALAWVKDQGELASEGYINMVYVMPGAMIDLLAIDIEGQVGVGPDDLNPIIGPERVPLMLIQRADAPWGDTLDEFVAYAKEHPGEIRHVSGGPGSGDDATMQSWVRRLGIEVKDVIGGNRAERALAVASGEGDVVVSPVDVFQPHLDGGRVEPILATGSDLPPPWDKLPTAQGTQGWTDDPFAETRGIAAASDVPEAHRDWLYNLYRLATQDPDYQQKRQQISGLQITDYTHDEVREIADSAIATVKPIYQEMGVYWADKK
jgi:tripartite-type tricarboxylate transporter receptor subunit TctC